ncbi:hypothetical protein OZX65_06685 [Leuconostocaceae bacterium ESL0723]|nr:hypothetical protein OZX65_06685 [Leuconostocaceae bacterium ESL0723]
MSKGRNIAKVVVTVLFLAYLVWRTLNDLGVAHMPAMLEQNFLIGVILFTLSFVLLDEKGQKKP